MVEQNAFFWAILPGKLVRCTGRHEMCSVSGDPDCTATMIQLSFYFYEKTLTKTYVVRIGSQVLVIEGIHGRDSREETGLEN